MVFTSECAGLHLPYGRVMPTSLTLFSIDSLQLRILLRAMELLKPGGRLVYSTCSFNPVENESVVAAAIRQNKSTSLPPSPPVLSQSHEALPSSTPQPSASLT